jgi:hypothetical protein
MNKEALKMKNYVVGVSFENDKFVLQEDALKKADFISVLESGFSKSGKSKEDFSIAIKPNLMMFTHKEDLPATYTDPRLVEHLIKMIQDKGYNNIKVVESRNMYGNWYENRTVKNVAKAAGYNPEDKGYEICDLTEEAIEYDYGGKLQKHLVGESWKEADFRISFAYTVLSLLRTKQRNIMRKETGTNQPWII